MTRQERHQMYHFYLVRCSFPVPLCRGPGLCDVMPVSVSTKRLIAVIQKGSHRLPLIATWSSFLRNSDGCFTGFFTSSYSIKCVPKDAH